MNKEFYNKSQTVVNHGSSKSFYNNTSLTEEEKAEIMRWFPPHNAIRSKTNPTDLIAKKCVAIETFAGSSQSKLTDEMVRETMKLCKEQLGECYFIFMSHKYLNGN